MLSNYGSRGDRTPEKRKVGGSTPPLTTRTLLTCGNADSGNGRSLRSSAGPEAVISVLAQRLRQREQPAVGSFSLVIGSLRFDLTVGRKPPACRAGERPLMWALVGRVTAAAAERPPFASSAARASVPSLASKLAVRLLDGSYSGDLAQALPGMLVKHFPQVAGKRHERSRPRGFRAGSQGGCRTPSARRPCLAYAPGRWHWLGRTDRMAHRPAFPAAGTGSCVPDVVGRGMAGLVLGVVVRRVGPAG